MSRIEGALEHLQQFPCEVMTFVLDLSKGSIISILNLQRLQAFSGFKVFQLF